MENCEIVEKSLLIINCQPENRGWTEHTLKNMFNTFKHHHKY